MSAMPVNWWGIEHSVWISSENITKTGRRGSERAHTARVSGVCLMLISEGGRGWGLLEQGCCSLEASNTHQTVITRAPVSPGLLSCFWTLPATCWPPNPIPCFLVPPCGEGKEQAVNHGVLIELNSPAQIPASTGLWQGDTGRLPNRAFPGQRASDPACFWNNGYFLQEQLIQYQWNFPLWGLAAWKLIGSW